VLADRLLDLFSQTSHREVAVGQQLGPRALEFEMFFLARFVLAGG